jgi:hypothetical protein
LLERIERLEKDIRAHLEDDLADRETKREAAERLRDIDVMRSRMSQDKPFERFLQQYLRDERGKYPDEREEPLCECGHPDCDLKQARLPACIRRADSVQAGIDEFQSRHPQGVVLLEAREEWNEQVADYRASLREIRADLVESGASTSTA